MTNEAGLRIIEMEERIIIFFFSQQMPNQPTNPRRSQSKSTQYQHTHTEQMWRRRINARGDLFMTAVVTGLAMIVAEKTA